MGSIWKRLGMYLQFGSPGLILVLACASASAPAGSTRPVSTGILSWLLRMDIAAMAKRGLAPADTFSHCMYAISGRLHLIGMITATTPSQAGPYMNRAIVAIDSLERKIPEAVHLSEKAGRKDKARWDQFQLQR